MTNKIVFDLGGVLLDWDPRHLFRKIFDDQDEMEYFLREICSPSWNAQLDAGKAFHEAVNELTLSYPTYVEQIRFYESRWEEMMGGELPGTVEILRELKNAGYPLAALSNWSAETFPRVEGDYPFLDWFDPILLSGQAGVAKPDPEIFRIFLERAGWLAEDCLYIDDMSDNIQEASRQGFQVVLFQSPEQLREELIFRELL